MSPRAAARLQELGFNEVYDYTAGKADWLANGLPVEGKHANDVRASALVDSGMPTCSLRDSPSAVRNNVGSTGFPACVVVDAHRVVLGLVWRASLENAPMGAQIEALMEDGPSTFRPDGSPESLLKYMERNDVDLALVTTARGRLLGAVTRESAQHAATS